MTILFYLLDTTNMSAKWMTFHIHPSKMLMYVQLYIHRPDSIYPGHLTAIEENRFAERFHLNGFR